MDKLEPNPLHHHCLQTNNDAAHPLTTRPTPTTHCQQDGVKEAILARDHSRKVTTIRQDEEETHIKHTMTHDDNSSTQWLH